MKRQVPVLSVFHLCSSVATAFPPPPSALRRTTPPGLEPGTREPKSLVLPLHHGVYAKRVEIADAIRTKWVPVVLRRRQQHYVGATGSASAARNQAMPATSLHKPFITATAWNVNPPNALAKPVAPGDKKFSSRLFAQGSPPAHEPSCSRGANPIARKRIQ
jgi:hypothetical protein